VAAEYGPPPYGLSRNRWRLEDLLNLSADSLETIGDIYPFPQGRPALLKFAQKLQRAARVLRSPPCPVPWRDSSRRRLLEQIACTLPVPRSLDEETFLGDLLMGDALRAAYPAAQQVLRGHPLWVNVPHCNDIRLYWLADVEETLAAMLSANEAVLRGEREAPWYEGRRCLWCDRALIAEVGGRGRPREYCRPSCKVQKSKRQAREAKRAHAAARTERQRRR
jgi:hypothetical protein